MLKIPYALTPAVAIDQRRAYMKSAIARGLERLDRHPATDTVLHVACYGPSLRDTFEALRGKTPILSMSGATKWLAERGIVADYHIEMDPRLNKVQTSLPPVPGVHYLIASCVAPEYFDQVLAAGNPVSLWHTVSTNWDDEQRWVSEHDFNGLVIHAGSTIGLAAFHVGGVLGYSRYEIHGMDGNFRDDTRHAGDHHGKVQAKNITWDVFRETFYTSRIMANAVAESVNTAENFPIITVWHGHGLTQQLIRKANLMNACCADETEKRAQLMTKRPVVIQSPPMASAMRTFWQTILDFLAPQDLRELLDQGDACEARRKQARYNTGTIPFQSAAYLRAISRFYKPEVIVEIGTFIGTSTLALLPTRVIYTCDRHNDCLPSTESIITHPYKTSADMLAEVQEPGGVDLFFFDGRLQAADLDHLKRLMKPGSVFVLDDFAPNQKGMANAQLLAPLVPQHTLITPGRGPSTLAVIAPTQRVGGDV